MAFAYGTLSDAVPLSRTYFSLVQSHACNLYRIFFIYGSIYRREKVEIACDLAGGVVKRAVSLNGRRRCLQMKTPTEFDLGSRSLRRRDLAFQDTLDALRLWRLPVPVFREGLTGSARVWPHVHDTPDPCCMVIRWCGHCNGFLRGRAGSARPYQPGGLSCQVRPM